MGRVKVLASITSTMSLTGETSSRAAMRGMKFFPAAVEGLSTAS